MADAAHKEKQAEKPPKATEQGPSGRVTATVVALATLAVIGAATANFLPNSDRFSLPNFDSLPLPKLDRLALPKFDQWSLPDFNRIAAPNSSRPAAASPPTPPPAPMPDPVVRAGLRDIQTSQQQHAAALESLTQNSEAQQGDLKRIFRQLSSLTAQVNALHGVVSPLTTSSIPHSNPRARIIRTSRRTPPAPPPLPKPVGPVSVGGAPLSPAPATGSGA